MITGIAASAAGALFMAAVSTLGDFIWAHWISHHRMVFGLTHGALLFLCVGLYLGAVAKRPAMGAVGGVLIGFAAAGGFYLLAPFVGYSAMFVMWFALWAALASLYRWLQNASAVDRTTFARGISAAVLSGVAFYAVSGIWRPFHPRGWDYAVHFVSWTVAFLPGFASLIVARKRTTPQPKQ
jgi:hypothetical protein